MRDGRHLALPFSGQDLGSYQQAIVIDDEGAPDLTEAERPYRKVVVPRLFSRRENQGPLPKKSYLVMQKKAGTDEVIEVAFSGDFILFNGYAVPVKFYRDQCLTESEAWQFYGLMPDRIRSLLGTPPPPASRWGTGRVARDEEG